MTVAAVRGLSSTEAARRRAEQGPNRLPELRRPSVVRRFGGELTHFFALMLWVAGALALLAGLPELGVAIFAVILLNAVFAFVQQARADRAAERLRAMLPTRVSVRRDGRRRIIAADEVVLGDLLLLESGDRVPADATVDRANCLLVDTSLLTGESAASAVGEAENLYAGTFVVEGEARAVVVARAVVLVSPAVVLAVDALDKHLRARARGELAHGPPPHPAAVGGHRRQRGGKPPQGRVRRGRRTAGRVQDQ
jgi:magnesium-transporting ATPase (P-type)